MSDRPITRAERKVLLRAKRWWEGKRPIAYGKAEHLANPTVNANATDAEKSLARAVAAMLVDRKRAARRQEESEP